MKQQESAKLAKMSGAAKKRALHSGFFKRRLRKTKTGEKLQKHDSMLLHVPLGGRHSAPFEKAGWRPELRRLARGTSDCVSDFGTFSPTSHLVPLKDHQGESNMHQNVVTVLCHIGPPFPRRGDRQFLLVLKSLGNFSGT